MLPKNFPVKLYFWDFAEGTDESEQSYGGGAAPSTANQPSIWEALVADLGGALVSSAPGVINNLTDGDNQSQPPIVNVYGNTSTPPTTKPVDWTIVALLTAGGALVFTIAVVALKKKK
jgi:hypothetical protein